MSTRIVIVFESHITEEAAAVIVRDALTDYQTVRGYNPNAPTELQFADIATSVRRRYPTGSLSFFAEKIASRVKALRAVEKANVIYGERGGKAGQASARVEPPEQGATAPAEISADDNDPDTLSQALKGVCIEVTRTAAGTFRAFHNQGAGEGPLPKTMLRGVIQIPPLAGVPAFLRALYCIAPYKIEPTPEAVQRWMEDRVHEARNAVGTETDLRALDAWRFLVTPQGLQVLPANVKDAPIGRGEDAVCCGRWIAKGSKEACSECPDRYR
jgi:hypothetical protein